jgi:GntR family histidine utilization transcriptional repressor
MAANWSRAAGIAGAIRSSQGFAPSWTNFARLEGQRIVASLGSARASNGLHTPAKATLSLHQRILGDIRGAILSGEWPPGRRIPFEHELQSQYGCSRMTVSKVLTELAHGKLIERRRKSGSFVLRPPGQSAVLEIQDIKGEVVALGLSYRHEIVARRKRKATLEDRDRLELASVAPVLSLTCRHFAGARPFCLEERLINLTAVPEAADERFVDAAPGAWLVSRVPWSAAEHKIRAVGADAGIANAHEIDAGTACLTIERRTWRAERSVTFVRLTYPGYEHELVARFTPSRR